VRSPPAQARAPGAASSARCPRSRHAESTARPDRRGAHARASTRNRHPAPIPIHTTARRVTTHSPPSSAVQAEDFVCTSAAKSASYSARSCASSGSGQRGCATATKPRSLNARTSSAVDCICSWLASSQGRPGCRWLLLAAASRPRPPPRPRPHSRQPEQHSSRIQQGDLQLFFYRKVWL
jgi:hypothetical protein